MQSALNKAALILPALWAATANARAQTLAVLANLPRGTNGPAESGKLSGGRANPSSDTRALTILWISDKYDRHNQCWKSWVLRTQTQPRSGRVRVFQRTEMVKNVRALSEQSRWGSRRKESPVAGSQFPVTERDT